MRNRTGLLFWVLLLAASLSIPIRAAEPDASIVLYYHDRPPYYHLDNNGTLTGVRFQQLQTIFELAELDVQWQSLPVNRILHQLNLRDGNHCSGGWFKTPDREQFAQFSNAFSTNEPATAITRVGYVPDEKILLSQLFIVPNARVLTKQGQYYGDYLEEAMRLYNVQRIEVPDEQHEIVQQIALGRGDIVFLNRVEAHYLLETHHHLQQRLMTVDLLDKGDIPELFIMCNQTMPVRLMQQINLGIDKFKLVNAAKADKP